MNIKILFRTIISAFCVFSIACLFVQCDTPYEKGLKHIESKDTLNAIRLFKEAALGEDSLAEKATIWLGNYYYKHTSIDDTMNWNTSMHWLERSGKLGNVQHLAMLYKMYAAHRAGYTDPAKEFEYCKLAAEKGNGLCMYELATFYNDSTLSRFNPNEAYKYYQKSADSGYELGMFRVARMYHYGEHYTKDIDKAQKWYKRAFDSGLTPAASGLVYIAFEKKDFDKAYECLKMMNGSTGYIDSDIVNFLEGHHKRQELARHAKQSKEAFKMVKKVLASSRWTDRNRLGTLVFTVVKGYNILRYQNMTYQVAMPWKLIDMIYIDSGVNEGGILLEIETGEVVFYEEITAHEADNFYSYKRLSLIVKENSIEILDAPLAITRNGTSLRRK